MEIIEGYRGRAGSAAALTRPTRWWGTYTRMLYIHTIHCVWYYRIRTHNRRLNKNRVNDGPRQCGQLFFSPFLFTSRRRFIPQRVRRPWPRVHLDDDGRRHTKAATTATTTRCCAPPPPASTIVDGGLPEFRHNCQRDDDQRSFLSGNTRAHQESFLGFDFRRRSFRANRILFWKCGGLKWWFYTLNGTLKERNRKRIDRKNLIWKNVDWSIAGASWLREVKIWHVPTFFR